jgi:hypothetical protein
VLSGKQPSGERIVWNDRKPFLFTKREQFALDLAKQQVVAWLHRDEPGQVQRLASAQRPGDAPSRIVRAADVARLAAANYRIKRLERFVERGRRVVACTW